MRKHAAYGLPISELDVVAIDDNESMLAILKAILGAFNVYRVRTFTDAEKALQAMIDSPPNFITCDWRMKPLDGHGLLRVIRHRRMAPLCFVPVMVVSGYASRSHVSKALLAGACQFLVKPVSSSALLERMTWVCKDPRQLVPDGERYAIEGACEALDEARRAGRRVAAREIVALDAH